MGTFARVAEPHAKRLVEPERLAEEQAALRRVATLVASGASSAAVFEAVAQEVAQVLQLPNAAVGRYDEDGTVMTLLAVFGDRPATFQPGSRWPLDGPSMSREVLRTGKPARVENYVDLPGTLAAEARERGFNRVAGAPIIVDGRVWGVIATSSPDAPLPDDLEERLAEFTELVATAIANSEAHDELTRLADEQAALRRVATLVAAGAAPAAVFEAVSTEVAALIPADGSALTRFDDDGSVTALSGWSAEGGYVYVGQRYDLEGTVSGVIFETGRPGRVDNYAEAPGKAPEAAREMGWRSSVGAPITVEGRLWGVLAVISKREEPLPPETERRLSAFTELVATAIANSQSREEINRLAEEQAALRRVATLVAAGAPAVEVFDSVTAEVAALIPADSSALTRYEADGTFTSLSGWAIEGGDKYVGRRFEREGSVSGLIFETGRPGRMENYAEAPGEASEVARELGWQSSVGAPITVEGRLWGALVVVAKSERPLPPDTERRLVGFTELVATAIANSEAHQELARLADEQAALRRVATLAAQGPTPGKVFEAVSAEVARLVGADDAGITRYEADGTFTAVGGWTSSGGHSFAGRRFPLEGSVSGLVLETSRPSRIDDFEGRSGEAAAAMREFGWRSAIGAPISVGGRLWGVLVVYSKSAEVLPPDTERRLGEFTEIVATAIANAESREEVNRLLEAQAALRRVATSVAQGAPPAEVFAAVSAEIGRLIPADAAALARYEDDGVATLLGGWAMTGAFPLEVGNRFSVDEGTGARAVLDTCRPARIDGYAAPTKIVDRVRAAGWHSWVAAPIIVEGGLWGFLTVASTTDRPLPTDTEERLAEFTDLVATAVANAEGRAELDASRARIVATADATRRRIERDLHDGAQQQLVSLALEVRAAQADAPEEMTKHREDLSHIAEGLTTVLDGLREIALGIHPAILAEGGLGPTLKTLAHRSPIPVDLDVREDSRLPESVEVAAYYVVSEALTNAAKHSDASRVEVVVKVIETMLRVTVRDDGAGGADQAQGSGLLGLKDRAEAIGGSIAVVSPRGVGTTLIAELPLDVTPSAAR
jgi:GAF domain-containing protein